VETATPRLLRQWRAGKVRLPGVTTTRRILPVPTCRRSARRACPIGRTWFGIFVPKRPDLAIAAKMNAAIKIALDDPATQKKMAGLGNTPRYETLEQFSNTAHGNRLKWAEVAKDGRHDDRVRIRSLFFGLPSAPSLACGAGGAVIRDGGA
jgi:tripartite-type tricarboxylate transporter receptor subunit TctC